MNTSELFEMLRRRCGCLYYAVKASDQLPKRMLKRRPAVMICNVDERHKPGSHWICIYIDENNFGEYFDSFGLPPAHVNFTKFLDFHCRGWNFNKRQLQHVFSDTCGHYCVTYALLRCSGYTLNDVLNCFTIDDFSLNDVIVRDFVINHL